VVLGIDRDCDGDGKGGHIDDDDDDVDGKINDKNGLPAYPCSAFQAVFRFPVAGRTPQAAHFEVRVGPQECGSRRRRLPPQTAPGIRQRTL
jgi:hypothetical protein